MPEPNSQTAAGTGTGFGLTPMPFSINDAESKKPSLEMPVSGNRVAVSSISIERVPMDSKRESENIFQSNEPGLMSSTNDTESNTLPEPSRKDIFSVCSI